MQNRSEGLPLGRLHHDALRFKILLPYKPSLAIRSHEKRSFQLSLQSRSIGVAYGHVVFVFFDRVDSRTAPKLTTFMCGRGVADRSLQLRLLVNDKPYMTSGSLACAQSHLEKWRFAEVGFISGDEAHVMVCEGLSEADDELHTSANPRMYTVIHANRLDEPDAIFVQCDSPRISGDVWLFL